VWCHPIAHKPLCGTEHARVVVVVVLVLPTEQRGSPDASFTQQHANQRKTRMLPLVADTKASRESRTPVVCFGAMLYRLFAAIATGVRGAAAAVCNNTVREGQQEP